MKNLMFTLFAATMLTACAGQEFCPAEDLVTWGTGSPAQESSTVDVKE